MVKIIREENLKFTRGLTKISKKTTSVVEGILDNVLKKRDNAVVEYTEKFDGWKVGDAENLKVSKNEIEEAYKSCSKETLAALEIAKLRIESYHNAQLPDPMEKMLEDGDGVECGWKWIPVESVGLYIPGGKAAYPSSVLMNAMPAIVAGVGKIVMATPTPKGEINPAVLAAAKIAGVTEIYKVGGAQAIAALTFETETIPNVCKIVGPGNAYVAEAKRQVFGLVGIDTIAGPSEILVISDNNSNPEWVAADLLSQAEHDEDARSILVTDSREFAGEVEKAVESQLKELDREEIARKSWEDNGLIVITRDIDEAVEVANQIAPEHLELCVDDAEKYLDEIKNAGAIFVGRYTPEAIGDYTAGPSHVLPTSGAARFSSGLSVYDFLKRSSVIQCSEEGFNNLADATELLANEEGFGAHSNSVSIRRKN